MSNSPEKLQNQQISHDSITSKKINSLLNSGKTRLEGLQLLNSYLPYCSDEDFVQFCVSWMQNCCKADGLQKNKDYFITLLSNLLKISSQYQELKKSVSFFITTRYFDYFFKYLLNSQAGWACTETCLLFYRGACGPLQESLEKQIANKIGSNGKIPLTVACCCALLPCVGGGGNEGINYKKNWNAQFIKFLNIVHSILNDLFSDVEELQEYDTFGQSFNKTNHEDSATYLNNQLYNYCYILNCMLLNKYPSPKCVPTDLVFQIVCRVLAVNFKSLAKRQTTEIIALQKVLPEVHCTILSLFKALIATCKNQLLPYAHLICRLLKQSLEWTESDISCEKDKLLGLRISIYETLCNWLAVAGSGSCVETISKTVLSCAVNDVESKKEIVLLKESKKKEQHKKIKQSNRRIDVKANDRLCHAALKALQFLIKFAGVLLKAEEHKFLQEVVVKLLVEVQKSTTSDMVLPFADSACRLELYSLLLELVHQPCPKWPPPTHFALRLFRQGITDRSPQVSLFCSTAINVVTIIIHPQFNNGGFPVQKESSTTSNQKEMEFEWTESQEEVQNGENIQPQEKINLEPEGSEVLQEKNLEKKGENYSELNLNKSDFTEKTVYMREESGASSDEDSRNTVTFSKQIEELNKEITSDAEEKEEEAAAESSPNSKAEKSVTDVKNRSTTEESAREKTSSPVKIKQTQNSTPEKVDGNVSSEAKSVSPESTNEEGQPKKRYFLRSKIKGSSEEPDEIFNRSSSIESLKNTPVRSTTKPTPAVQSSKKRLRTKVLSKTETNSETESGTPKRSRSEEEDDDYITHKFQDELEEANKQASSNESIKNREELVKGSVKGTPALLSSKNRPRTRALSKIESNSETELNTPKTSRDPEEEDEDIIAVFHESLIE